MESLFQESSACLNLASGLLLVIYWYAFAIFMPYGKLSTTLEILVENRNWGWINTLALLGPGVGHRGRPLQYSVRL
jgi:hypothetical protein